MKKMMSLLVVTLVTGLFHAQLAAQDAWRKARQPIHWLALVSDGK